MPYLADKDQTAREAFGARRSQEVFLLSAAGGKFTIAYSVEQLTTIHRSLKM